MDNINLVKDALMYYDKNREKYKKILSSDKYFKIIHNKKDMEYNVIVLYDDNKKEIYRSRYEMIGIYDEKYSLWTWAWSIVGLRKNSTSIIRKILNYGLELDPEDNFLKMELINSRFRISSLTQIDVHVALASYLSKKPFIYELFMSNETDSQISDNKEEIHEMKYTDDSILYYIFLLDYE
jgi:hypothetical protein